MHNGVKVFSSRRTAAWVYVCCLSVSCLRSSHHDVTVSVVTVYYVTVACAMHQVETNKYMNKREKKKKNSGTGRVCERRKSGKLSWFPAPKCGRTLVKIITRWPAQGRKARQACGMFPNRVVSLTWAVLSAIALVKSTTEIKWLKNLQAQVLHRSRCVWLDQSGYDSSPPGWTTASTSVTIPWREHAHIIPTAEACLASFKQELNKLAFQLQP